MSTTAQVQGTSFDEALQGTDWKFLTRIAFRFCFLYFGLYCLLTQIFSGLIPLPGVDSPDLSSLPPFREIVIWIADHVLNIKPVVYAATGSGDRVFDWVLSFCLLAIALAGTCAWSSLDRRRTNYDSLYKWFRLFLRFALAGQLFVYGIVKAIPLQMPFPPLTRFLERFGDFSPMGVLWSSVGVSPAYERFAGCAELLAAVLLVIPATTMLGALLCLMDMTEVFVLNMTFDIPVKLFSFQLILMAVFLLIPDRSRLVSFCFRDCEVAPPTTCRLLAGKRANRIAIAAQLVFGSLLFAADVHDILQQWFKYGGGAPKPPLYGIWNVDEMSIDGIVRSPLVTDYDRWRRVVFDVPEAMAFERMDDSIERFVLSFDAKRSSLALTKTSDPKWSGQLGVHHYGANRITLDGKLGQHITHIQLSLMAGVNSFSSVGASTGSRIILSIGNLKEGLPGS